MNKFYVVGCPRCGWIRGIDATAKTTTCTHCGKRSTVSKLAILATAKNEEELPTLVSHVRAQREGREVPVEMELSQPVNIKTAPTRKMTPDEVARELSDNGAKSFTRSAFIARLEKEGINRPEEKLDKLLKAGVLMEPWGEEYKWLG